MKRTYVALGDSMSIDLYTNVEGGGAVNQFHRQLGSDWRLNDFSRNGGRIPWTPSDQIGDLITLTVGGNDLLAERDIYLFDQFKTFQRAHFRLLEAIRARNPKSLLIVGNIYNPQKLLDEVERAGLMKANEIIAQNTIAVKGVLADVHSAFAGHEEEYLCYGIEPTYKGASVIANLFWNAYLKWKTN